MESNHSEESGIQPPSDPHFQAVFNDPNVLMALLDAEGTIRQINRAAIELVSPTEAELVGTPFWEGPWWGHSERVQAEMREGVEHAAKGGYGEFEVDYVTGSDEERLTAGVFRPVTDDDGEVFSIIVSGRAITDHVDQEQRLDVLQRILRHNFRNKLTVIRGQANNLLSGFSDLLSDEVESELEHPARVIREETDHLESSVEKVLRLEHGIPNTRERTRIEAMVSDVVEGVQDEHAECTVETDLPDETTRVPAPLNVAVSEAVGNAVEHHPDPDPVVELSATVDRELEPPSVLVDVIDEGPGIPREEVDPVLDGEETALTHTTGIGLWLIRWTMDHCGGDLSIHSTAGRGTRVTMTCPLRAVPVGD